MTADQKRLRPPRLRNTDGRAPSEEEIGAWIDEFLAYSEMEVPRRAARRVSILARTMLAATMILSAWTAMASFGNHTVLLYCLGIPQVGFGLTGAALRRHQPRERDDVYSNQALGVGIGVTICVSSTAWIMFGMAPICVAQAVFGILVGSCAWSCRTYHDGHADGIAGAPVVERVVEVERRVEVPPEAPREVDLRWFSGMGPAPHGTGHIYIIVMSTDRVKVGKTNDIPRRVSEHRREASTFGAIITDVWFTPAFAEWHVVERQLIAEAASMCSARYRHEYFSGVDDVKLYEFVERVTGLFMDVADWNFDQV